MNQIDQVERRDQADQIDKASPTNEIIGKDKDLTPNRQNLSRMSCLSRFVRSANAMNSTNPMNDMSATNSINAMNEFTLQPIYAQKWKVNKQPPIPRRMLDTSKAEKEFGFKAKTPLGDGLKKTVEWYLSRKK